jgi:glycine/D-amino acid oxidase-like deaminating enzyme/nitrite reductase/ring-hydroxylating ferredoxin subunit
MSDTSAEDSVWLAKSPHATTEHSPIPQEVAAARYDVAVIGAGLAGLAAATRLNADGAKVVVIEAGTVGGRTTGHSTAKVTALHGLTYAALERSKGPEAAAAYAHANNTAVAELGSLVATSGIECEWTPATAFTCATTSSGVKDVEAEAAAAQRAGLDVDVRGDVGLPIPVLAAVALADQAHVDPIGLCRGLADRLRDGGVPVVEGLRVIDVDESDQCVVRAPNFELRSEYAVLCTHLPVVDPALLAARTRADRSYAVAGPPRASGPLREVPDGMYIAPDAGWSIRPYAGSDGPAIISGGEGHPMIDNGSTAAHYDRLTSWATDQLGIDVRHRWSAFDYTPVDGVPFIGRLAPGSRRRFVATGFRKWGLTTSVVAAAIIADEIAGRTHAAAKLFDATRQVPTVGRNLVSNNMKVAVRFVGDRLRARSDAAEDVRPGAGRVVRSGRRMVAVAETDDGVRHTLDARCTHLGCLVGFNDAEQTWDCPCHGSRFALDGTVLDGPARQPLRPVEI